MHRSPTQPRFKYSFLAIHYISLFFGMVLSQITLADDQCIPHDKWLLPTTGKTLNTTQFLPTLINRRVILLGEHHANALHHHWQLNMLQQLHQLRKNIILGFEVFPRRLQPILNQWIEQTIDQDDFIKAIDWNNIWGFDLALYMPLFEFARNNRIPMRALNVDKNLLKLVKEKGWPAIPLSQREGLSEPATPLRKYVQRLAISFKGHGIIEENLETFKTKFLRFVQQQLVWDVAMSDAIAANVTRSSTTTSDTTKTPLFIGIIGSWHLISRHGVPYQLTTHNINDSVVLIPWDEYLDCDSITPSFADGIYGTFLSSTSTAP